MIGAAIGNCVHVGGLHHFLKIAETEGYITTSLGPAVSVNRILKAVNEEKPEILAISYRLTPETGAELFRELAEVLKDKKDLKIIFGGTPPVAAVARKSGLFEKIFDGTEPPESILQYLRGGGTGSESTRYSDSLVKRIEDKYPYPLIRHHFGRPSLQETVEGASIIAESGVLDVLSIGPDQNAQEHFFHPQEMDHNQDGAGGVPVRKPEDLEAIYKATRRGNFPLVRCYAGTRDLLRWAEMSVRTINNAWAAIPLCWYSVIDGRSKRPVADAIKEHQEVIRWYASRNIPVEVNESHQWSLRDAHDALAVAMAFLAAWNARKAGVKHYVSQYMFNTPPATTAEMDIAKMLAKDEMIESLSDSNFTVLREVRAGLAHLSPVPSVAMGQLAASAAISLSLKPHILHVVGYSEGDHAIFADELIQSCNIVHGVLRNLLHGMPDITGSDKIKQRKEELKSEAGIILEELQRRGRDKSEDPWSDADNIAEAIRTGLLDAPHFKGNLHLFGEITTRLIDGAYYAVDRDTGEPLSEQERIERLAISRRS